MRQGCRRFKGAAKLIDGPGVTGCVTVLLPIMSTCWSLAPGPRKDLTGRIEGLEQFRHFAQRLRVTHRGARPESLTVAAVVLPPEYDPIPAGARLAFLEAAALKATAARGYRFRDDRGIGHRSRR